MQSSYKLCKGLVFLSLAATLSACSVAETIDAIPMPKVLGETTSVAEAKAQKQAALSPKVTSDALVEPGYLTVGIRANAMAPFSYVAQDGSLEGMDYYVASALAEKLGLKVKFVNVGAANSAGTNCDVVMNAKSSDQGPFVVVGNYAESSVAFFQKGSKDMLTADALGGKSVALQSGSISEDTLKHYDLKVKVMGYNNLNDAFSALNGGSANLVLSDLYSGAYLATDYSDIHYAGSIDVPVTIGVAVAKDNESLQTAVADALTEIASGGQLDIIKKLWVGGQESVNQENQIQNIPVNEAYAANATMAAASE